MVAKREVPRENTWVRGAGAEPVQPIRAHLPACGIEQEAAASIALLEAKEESDGFENWVCFSQHVCYPS